MTPIIRDDFIGGPGPGVAFKRHSTRPFHDDAAACYLRVEAMLVPAGGITVEKPNELVSIRLNFPADPYLRCRRMECPPEVIIPATGADALSNRIEGIVLIAQTKDYVCQPRCPERAHLEPGRGTLEKRIFFVVEPGHLPPRILVRVSTAPIVVLTADPVIDYDHILIDAKDATVIGEGPPHQGLGRREFAIVIRARSSGRTAPDYHRR